VKILHLIPRLDWHGTGRQLFLLATSLPRSEFALVVAVLQEAGPLGNELAEAGIAVESLPPRRLIHLARALQVRELLRHFEPNLVHVWQIAAVRWLRLAAWRLPPVVVSAPLGGELPSLLDRWLLRRVARVLVRGETEAERYCRMGVGENKLVRVPLAVAEPPHPVGDVLVPGLPPTARCIACIGEFNVLAGFRDAVWAFDILRFLYPDLRLLMIGDGPYRPQVEDFARKIDCAGSVHFLGDRPAEAALLARCEVVWVGDGTDVSVGAALAALAAGRPVVGPRHPVLAEIVVEGETGCLVPPGRQSALARATRFLLDDASRRQAMGEAALQRARKAFPVSEMVRRVAMMYQDVHKEHGA
jgi:glycosyltransferase involved in cell wall biosynthesis